MDVLIVVYSPKVYLIEVKVELTFTYFSWWTNYYFVIKSIQAFYFVNNVVVYKALLVQWNDVKLVYKIFIIPSRGKIPEVGVVQQYEEGHHVKSAQLFM